MTATIEIDLTGDPTPDWDDPAWSSYSALTTHRVCPQRWFYAYVRKLKRIESEVAKPHLDFGNWWHALRAAHAIEKGRHYGTLKYAPKKLKTTDEWEKVSTDHEQLRKAVLASCNAYWRSLSDDVKDIWVEVLGEALPKRLLAVYKGWVAEHADEHENERPIAVELFWKRQVPGATKKSILGYIDEVYLDVKRNLVIARDHKSSKGLSTMSAVDDLLDSQLQLYAWGAAPMLKEWGYVINAVSYDRVRSVAPKQPKLTASGGLSASVKDYDLATYLAWVGDGITWGEEGAYFLSGPRKGKPKFGVYTADEAVIERLSQPAVRSAWFQRTRKPLNRNIILAHLNAAIETMKQQERTVVVVNMDGAAPRNFAKDNCRWCDFSSLCQAEMVGGADGEYPLEEHKLMLVK